MGDDASPTGSLVSPVFITPQPYAASPEFPAQAWWAFLSTAVRAIPKSLPLFWVGRNTIYNPPPKQYATDCDYIIHHSPNPTPPRPNFQHKLLGLFYLMSFPLLTRFSMSRPHSGHSKECRPQTALQKGHLQRQSSFDNFRSEINVDLKNAANISNITITNRISATPQLYAASPEFPAQAWWAFLFFELIK